MAHRSEPTIAEARQLWWLVDRPNLMVKIPATPEGVPAISQALAEGISVNVTLIFGLERYSQVIDAFFEGMERARAAGLDLSTISSVASFFISRVDTEVDKRLEAIGTAQADGLRGKAAIANARLAYQLYEEAFASERWAALAEAGAKPQRPLWASTSTKDPSYADTMYVAELITAGTVNTMPQATLEAFADHGVTTEDTVRGNYAAARRVWDELAEVGVDYDDVIRVLDEEGVSKFEASWAELLETITTELKARGA
jgi:transaldolase